MKIDIKELANGTVNKSVSYDPNLLDMEFLSVAFEGFPKIEADISLLGQELVVNCRICYTLKLACSRCLENFELYFDKNCVLNYNIQNLNVLDITDDIREEIMLGYPVKPLCRPDCRGICLSCKTNLNLDQCKCAPNKQ